MRAYHDEEWGAPVHDERALFEFLVLEGAQAGLSWSTVLTRRDAYRSAFKGFDLEAVAGFDEARVDDLLADEGLIRNRKKMQAAVGNARAAVVVREESGSLDEYLWSFVGGMPIVNRFRRLDDIPSTSPEAKQMSKDLKRRGFSFVGPTICYAFMQATGMVNDHVVSCFRHSALAGSGPG
jgi:DNA-3-methyladenine glycosylase I